MLYRSYFRLVGFPTVHLYADFLLAKRLQLVVVFNCFYCMICPMTYFSKISPPTLGSVVLLLDGVLLHLLALQPTVCYSALPSFLESRKQLSLIKMQ